MRSFDEYSLMVNEYLEKLFSENDGYQKLIFDSMRYSLLAGGKRIRPVLCLAAAEAMGEAAEKVLPVACAIEMIHTYSLIHDDLPCMDNDDYRRGRLTNHKVYGEGMAVLAGDALLTESFGLAASAEIEAARLVKIIGLMSRFSGVHGMIGGQVVDIEAENRRISEDELRFLHENKTSALIRESLMCGAAAGGAEGEVLESFDKFGLYLGLAFQVQDDILDVCGSAKELGKPVGSDAENGKNTYVSMFGLEQARVLAEDYTKKANSALAGIAGEEFFINFANGLLNRKK